MFNLPSSTPSNTSLFGQSTPINQNRTGSGFLFGNTTTTQPSTLTSTPFNSTSLFGKTIVRFDRELSIVLPLKRPIC